MKLFVCIALMFAGMCLHAGEYYIPKVGRSVKPRMEVVQTEQRDGYECQYVEFDVEKGERVAAYLLVPYGASRHARKPAVVMLHDHGARFDIGKEKLVRPIESLLPDGSEDHIARSAHQWIDKNFDGVYFADSLASLGYVVLVADALYWGERSSDDAQRWSELAYGRQEDDKDAARARKQEIKRLKNVVYEGQCDVYDSLQRNGVIWAEKMLRDDVASVRLLASLPYVDADNIGAFGFSMGAHRCWMLAAFCPEVKCGAALSWMTTLDRSEEMKASDYSMAVMPMREQLDFGDIGMFLVPKPMLFLNGEKDHLFPKENVQEAFRKLNSYYDAAGSDELRTEFFPGGHHCGKDVQKTITAFLDSILS